MGERLLAEPHGITEQAHRLRAKGGVLYSSPVLTQALLNHALRSWNQSLLQLIIFRTADAVKAYYELELYWGLHCLAQPLSPEEQEDAFTRFKKHYDFVTEEALATARRQEHSGGAPKKSFRKIMHSLNHYSTALQQAATVGKTELFSSAPLEFTQALKYEETIAAHPDFMNQKLEALDELQEIARFELKRLEKRVSLKEQDEASLEKLQDFHATYRLARGAGLRPVTRPVADDAIYSKMRLFTLINHPDLEPQQVEEGLRDYKRFEVSSSALIPWAEGFVEELRELYSPFAPQYMHLHELALRLATQLTHHKPTEFRTLTANKLRALLKQVIGHRDELALYSECLSIMQIYRKRTTASVLQEELFEEFEVRLEATLLLQQTAAL